MTPASKLALSAALVELSDTVTLAHRQLLDLRNMQAYLDTQAGLIRAQMEKLEVMRIRLENIVAAGQAAMIGGGTLGALP